MCGRFALVDDGALLRQQFAVDYPNLPLFRYNIAPTEQIVVIYELEGERRADDFRWGLVPWWAKTIPPAPLINKRVETLGSNPGFKRLLQQQRCLIPMTGFFEWVLIKDKKQPFFIRGLAQPLLAAAGLWSQWQTPAGETLWSACLITTDAFDSLHQYHARMPFFLNAQQQVTWLSEKTAHDDLLSLLDTHRVQEFVSYPVTQAMNNVHYKETDAITPLN